MRYTHEVAAYNARRYSRPWIAAVTAWPIGAYPALRFGASLDTTLCEIEAEPGSIIRFGQKDHRGGHTVQAWAIAQADGTLLESDARACREHYEASRPVTQIDNDNVVALRA